MNLYNVVPLTASKKKSHELFTFLAPVLGIDVSQPLAYDVPKTAFYLENLIPRTYGCVLRSGYWDYAINLSGPVRTLIDYTPREGSDQAKLFAASGTFIYDVSTSTLAPNAVITGLAPDDGSIWSFVTFSGLTQNFLILCNKLNGTYTYSNETGFSKILTFDKKAVQSIEYGGIKLESTGFSVSGNNWIFTVPSTVDLRVNDLLRISGMYFSSNPEINLDGYYPIVSLSSTQVTVSGSGISIPPGYVVSKYPTLSVQYTVLLKMVSGVNYALNDEIQVVNSSSPAYNTFYKIRKVVDAATYVCSVNFADPGPYFSNGEVLNYSLGITSAVQASGFLTITVPGLAAISNSVNTLIRLEDMVPNQYNGTYKVVSQPNSTTLVVEFDQSYGPAQPGGKAVLLSYITGEADPNKFDFVTVWKNRVWFFEDQKTEAHYLPFNSISGELSTFDFGPQFRHGGSLAYITNWSVDAGVGLDDHMVVVSTEGDVLVYKGTDPDTNFEIVGAWYVGKIPKGRRAFEQYGGDVYILSSNGLISLSILLTSADETSTRNSLSSKIRPILQADYNVSNDYPCWEVRNYPPESLVIISAPKEAPISGIKDYALVMPEGSWFTLHNWDSLTYGEFKGELYYGTQNGKVCKAFYGDSDGLNHAQTVKGPLVEGRYQQAFSPLKEQGLLKEIHLIKPVIISNTTPEYIAKVSTDFGISQVLVSGGSGLSSAIGSLWGTALWGTALWSGSANTYYQWSGVNELGYFASTLIAVRGDPGTTILSTDILFTYGGPVI